MDKLDIIREKFRDDKFAQNLGIVIDELADDFVKMHMLLTPKINNFYDRPHGAAIYGLADAAFSVIGNNQNVISVALDCSITYHSSPNTGQVLHVEGSLIKQTRRIGTYIFKLYTENDGKKEMVATMLSTLYRTDKPIKPELKEE
ncbi:MAG: PaaI family thioesterase [Promethearchaeota archaeon]|nr:MAG: PaaI family thioesterase [Candidatus Lokiarchaeota archaeon]